MDRRHVGWGASSPDGGVKVRVRRRAGGEVTGEGDGTEVTLAGLGPRGHPGSLRGASSEEPGEGSDCRRLGRSRVGGGQGRRGAGASGLTHRVWSAWTSGSVHLARAGVPGWPWASAPAWRFVSSVPRAERQEDLACPCGGRRRGGCRAPARGPAFRTRQWSTGPWPRERVGGRRGSNSSVKRKYRVSFKGSVPRTQVQAGGKPARVL